jgi:hypothetical protein
MLKTRMPIVALATTALVSSMAFAAEQPTKPIPTEQSAKSISSEQAAEQDFGKLSADGLKAFRDVRMTRLAIFDARPNDAKKYVDEAQAALEKARMDKAAFKKAESALRPPAGVAQPGGDKAAADTSPTTWLPVNGALTLSEDLVATPDKAAGLAKANEQLKKGDHKQAMEALKASNIDVTFVMEVAPLDKTITGVASAAQLIQAGKYYEANQALKGVEDGLRFDVAEFTPDGTKSGSAAKSAPTASPPSPAVTPAPAPKSTPAPSAK